MSQDGAAQPPGSANPAALQRPRRRWWRWLLLLPVLYLVFDEVFTLIEFEPPYCGHAYYEMIEGETREAYRANLIRILDAWGERYWEFEGGTLLRYDFEFLDDFAESFQ
jgi:hypothetical protein